jgi:hypothetical protein
MVLRPGLGAGGGEEEEERGEGLAEARTAADAPAEADDHSRGEQDCTSIFFFVDYFISFFFFLFLSPVCTLAVLGRKRVHECCFLNEQMDHFMCVWILNLVTFKFNIYYLI